MLKLIFSLLSVTGIESLYVPPKVTFQNYTEYLGNGWSWLFIGKTWCGHTQKVEPIWFDFAEKYPVIQNHSLKYGYAMLDEPYRIIFERVFLWTVKLVMKFVTAKESDTRGKQ